MDHSYGGSKVNRNRWVTQRWRGRGVASSAGRSRRCISRHVARGLLIAETPDLQGWKELSRILRARRAIPGADGILPQDNWNETPRCAASTELFGATPLLEPRLACRGFAVAVLPAPVGAQPWRRLTAKWPR